MKMKFMKLFSSAAAACLLAGASGGVMARNDCPDGSIVGETVNNIIIDEFVSCTVLGVVVKGMVRVSDADQFTMKGGVVNGSLRVENVVSAFVSDVTINEGNLVTLGNRYSTVLRNVVSGGNIIVNDDECVQQQVVTVVQNLIFVGNAIVNCNEKADVKENKVTDGSIACRGNDRLDSKDNDAFGGTVNCSRSLLN